LYSISPILAGIGVTLYAANVTKSTAPGDVFFFGAIGATLGKYIPEALIPVFLVTLVHKQKYKF